MLVFMLVLTGCSGNVTSIDDASEQYKKEKTYASLEVIYNNLSKGMPRQDVLRLLGEPDYSPTEGQYYYSSDKKALDEGQEKQVTVGLVVDYRNDEDEITESLQGFSMESMGE